MTSLNQIGGLIPVKQNTFRTNFDSSKETLPELGEADKALFNQLRRGRADGRSVCAAIKKMLVALESRDPRQVYLAHVWFREYLCLLATESVKYKKEIRWLGIECKSNLKQFKAQDPYSGRRIVSGRPLAWGFLHRMMDTSQFVFKLSKCEFGDLEMVMKERIGSDLSDLAAYLGRFVEEVQNAIKGSKSSTDDVINKKIEEHKTVESTVSLQDSRGKDRVEKYHNQFKLIFRQLNDRSYVTDTRSDKQMLDDRLSAISSLKEFLALQMNSKTPDREAMDAFLSRCRIEYEWDFDALVHIGMGNFYENYTFNDKHWNMMHHGWLRCEPVLMWYCLKTESNTGRFKNEEAAWLLRETVKYKDYEEVFLDEKEAFFSSYGPEHLYRALTLYENKLKLRWQNDREGHETTLLERPQPDRKDSPDRNISVQDTIFHDDHEDPSDDDSKQEVLSTTKDGIR